MSGHTPGPWVHYDDSQDGKTNRHEICAIGKTVCHIYHSVPAEDLANARLIAAAPDLLEAAKLVISWWDKYASRGPYVPAIEDAEWDEFRKLRSAIAKAEGNKHD